MVFQIGNTLGEANKGKSHAAWDKGLTKDTDPRLVKIGISVSKSNPTRIPNLSRAMKGKPSPRKGVTLLETTKNKLSLARLGNKYPKLSEAKKGKPTWNCGVTGYHNSPYPQSFYDSRGKCLVISKPTKPEIKLGELIGMACPGEYIYTGNGSLVIQGCCPDYANINGQKKVIEMFGNFWHSDGSNVDRIERFKSFGYDCLVIWESELKEKSKDELVALISKFNGR